jgi:hypothetical protein
VAAAGRQLRRSGVACAAVNQPGPAAEPQPPATPCCTGAKGGESPGNTVEVPALLETVGGMGGRHFVALVPPVRGVPPVNDN